MSDAPTLSSKNQLTTPERSRLRTLVDDVWNAATDGREVPSVIWADQIIDKWFAPRPPAETSPLLDASLRRLGENDEEIKRLRDALGRIVHGQRLLPEQIRSIASGALHSDETTAVITGEKP